MRFGDYVEDAMNVREQFPHAFTETPERYGQLPTYDELVRAFGYEVLVNEESGIHSGDSWYFLKDGNRYGFLEFGWGSCSGCDALEACYSFSALQSLADSLEGSIVWRESKHEMRQWMEAHDFSADFSTDIKKVDFLNRVLQYVGSWRVAFLHHRRIVLFDMGDPTL